jgi:hypothetical protein
MLTSLKTMLVENEQPVGIKKHSNWKLPDLEFSYGKVVPKDKEGVSISNISLIFSNQKLAKS